MKIIEINNRKDTYVYDEEYCEFFNDDGDWEHLDPNDISQEFEIPKERETLVLKQGLQNKVSSEHLSRLERNSKGEYTAEFSGLDAEGDFPFKGMYYSITWFKLRPKHNAPAQSTSEESSSISLSRKKLLLTKYFK
ncbi:MAG: hypothetical protein ACM67R_05090 [Clostridiales bacterium]